MNEGGGAGWFEGDVARNDAESAFVRQLRQEASSWQLVDLAPRDTRVRTWASFVPLIVEVEVPGLPNVANLRRTLRIGFWNTTPSAPSVEGEWGNESLLENHDADDTECLTVRGFAIGVEELASISGRWLHRQLGRPVEREDWLHQGEVFASRWRLQETGDVLGVEGSWFRRAISGQPDRIIELRK